LQRAKRALSPVFTALRRNLNRIATGHDGSGGGTTLRRYGGQMLMVRCNCVVGAARLARVPKAAVRVKGQNAATSKRRNCSIFSRWRTPPHYRFFLLFTYSSRR
jgi:hypothetical protein